MRKVENSLIMMLIEAKHLSSFLVNIVLGNDPFKRQVFVWLSEPVRMHIITHGVL